MARAGCEARTEELLAAISGKRLLCLGDVMLDRFVHGRVERISPEAPIPVLSIEGEWETRHDFFHANAALLPLAIADSTISSRSGSVRSSSCAAKIAAFAASRLA